MREATEIELHLNNMNREDSLYLEVCRNTPPRE
jgi:hypothetical protein